MTERLRMRFLLFVCAAVGLTACAGKVDYVRPSASPAAGANVKLIEKPRDAVWALAVPQLGKQFYVINNLDKASGLINLSYTGDPERFVDCGRITSYVKNAQGERNYNFPGAKSQQSYEIMNPGVGLFFIDRRMSLEGRINVIFEEVGPAQTRVTTNTRYVVQRQRVIRNAGNSVPQTLNDSVTFNSGGSAAFSGPSDSVAECVATGALEREILEAIR
jgi:hypothetical protein